MIVVVLYEPGEGTKTMRPRGNQNVQYGSAKRQKGEIKERRADKRKGRQKDKKLCREGREEASR